MRVGLLVGRSSQLSAFYEWNSDSYAIARSDLHLGCRGVYIYMSGGSSANKWKSRVRNRGADWWASGTWWQVYMIRGLLLLVSSGRSRVGTWN